ncbi:MAG: hypothetical protein ACRDQZ_02105, partial [Mycobacteriales bacterium]
SWAGGELGTVGSGNSVPSVSNAPTVVRFPSRGELIYSYGTHCILLTVCGHSLIWTEHLTNRPRYAST